MSTQKDTLPFNLKNMKYSRSRFFISLLLSLMGAFLLGEYTFSTVHDVREIELHRWIMTSFVTLFFIFITFYNRKY